MNYYPKILPFYMTYPMPLIWEEEDTVMRDLEYLQELYPRQAKKYRKRIEELLERFDSEGSVLYDEYPDRMTLYKMAQDIYAVLEQEEFPRSYSVEFRGKEKLYLPIPGLPKKGVNQLFACAVQHPNLHPAIERYARLAMREYEWYQNLADEACAMPGSFAVFALGLEGEQWAPLVAEYLDLCDDEHSSLQAKFLHALIRKFGFQPWTLGVLVRGALSMQWLKPAKEFRSLIANAESLDALLAVKSHFSAYLLPEENEDPKLRAIAWQCLLWAIWGPSSENGGSKAIKAAPKELRERYEEIFQ